MACADKDQHRLIFIKKMSRKNGGSFFMNKLSFRHFDATPAEENNTFVPLLTIFDTDDRLVKLTDTTKKGYSLLRSRLAQSFKHPDQFQDARGQFFVRYSINELAWDLGQKSINTAKTVKKHLANIGLIECIPDSSIIYVLDVLSLPDQEKHRIQKPKNFTASAKAEKNKPIFFDRRDQNLAPSNITSASLYTSLLRTREVNQKQKLVSDWLRLQGKVLTEEDEGILLQLVSTRTTPKQVECLILVLEDNLFRSELHLKTISVDAYGTTPDAVRRRIIENKLGNLRKIIESKRYYLTTEQLQALVYQKISKTAEKYILDAVTHLYGTYVSGDIDRLVSELEYYTVQQPNIFWFCPDEVKKQVWNMLDKTTRSVITASRFTVSPITSNEAAYSDNLKMALLLKSLLKRRIEIEQYERVKVLAKKGNLYISLVEQAYSELRIEQKVISIEDLTHRAELLAKKCQKGELTKEKIQEMVQSRKAPSISRIEKSRGSIKYAEPPIMENHYSKEHLERQEEISAIVLDIILIYPKMSFKEIDKLAEAYIDRPDKSMSLEAFLSEQKCS